MIKILNRYSHSIMATLSRKILERFNVAKSVEILYMKWAEKKSNRVLQKRTEKKNAET